MGKISIFRYTVIPRLMFASAQAVHSERQFHDHIKVKLKHDSFNRMIYVDPMHDFGMLALYCHKMS